MNILRLQIKGGLGNQLFQYFAGLYLAQVSNRKFQIDVSWYLNQPISTSNLYPRVFELEKFNLPEEVESVIDTSFQSSVFMDRVTRRVPRQFGLKLGSVFELRPDEFSKRSILRINGYWLSQNYLPPRNELLEFLIGNLKQPSNQYLELVRESELVGPLAIHVRLGDYLNFPEIFPVLGLDYYARSVAVLKQSKGVDQPIWLFSDEPEKAFNLLEGKLPISKVIGPRDLPSSPEVLALLSMSSAIICSNSTFSWWAGFLSKNQDQVVFPTTYMNGFQTKETGLWIKSWNYL